MTMFTFFFLFSLFWLQILNLPASLQNKNTRVGPFPWKRSALQNLNRERTNHWVSHIINPFTCDSPSQLATIKKVKEVSNFPCDVALQWELEILDFLLKNRCAHHWNHSLKLENQEMYKNV